MPKSNLYSGIFVVCRIDPFYQQFLRAQFKQKQIIFRFPHNHDLEVALKTYLTNHKPETDKPTPTGNEAFRLAIPPMDHKDPREYNKLSDKKQQLLADKIKRYYRHVIHDEIGRLRQKGFHVNEIIYIILEDFNFNFRYYDRVEKEYKRWLNSQRLKRFRQREKRKKYKNA